MKKLIILSAFTFSGLMALSQTIKENIVEPFTTISLSGAVSVKYKTSDTSKLVISGNQSDMNNIEFSQTGKTLYVKSKGKINDPVTIVASSNGLNEVIASGASSFKMLDKINSDDFKIDVTGASNVHAAVVAKKVHLIMSGASDVTLKGTAGMLDVTNSGASSLKAYDLLADTALINASGASSSKLFASQKISINATGASTVKFKGDPKEVSAEGGTASKIMKIGSDDASINTNPQDTSKNKTTFKYKNKQIIIIEGDDKDTTKKSNASDLTRRHWQGLWMGFAGYTNPQMAFNMNSPYNYMELDYGRSYSFQWNIGQKNLNLYKKYIQLSTGIGLHFNNYKFENNTRLNADSSFTWGTIDSTGYYSYTKNRFKQSYAVVPLLLNFNTSKSLKRNAHLSVGVVGKYLLNSKTKQVLTRFSDEYTFKRKDSYNLNPFQVDAYASVGYRNFTVYAQYALTEMFKAKKGPELYPFSVGIRLVSFD